jgi:hypothetical protein
MVRNSVHKYGALTTGRRDFLVSHKVVSFVVEVQWSLINPDTLLSWKIVQINEAPR